MVFLKRVLAAVLTLGFFAAALVFASIFLAMVAGAVVVIGGWLWWRTRALRREVARTAPTIVEGEFREVPPQRLEAGRNERPRG